MSLKNFLQRTKKTDSSPIHIIIRYLWYLIFYKKRIIAHQASRIRGINRIKCSGLLDVGIGFVGFMHKRDTTYLNIQGNLKIKGDYSIGRGCRIDVNSNGNLIFGKNGYLNPNTTIIAMNSITIGDRCAISWDCLILDDDFHSISYADKKEDRKEIHIGDDVWIGRGVSIYSGTKIANNCVIAANSVVRGIFSEPNTLIAGIPAKVIRSDVKWSM